jgi:hypothetical protein
METATADEGELLVLARTGDEGAFNALVETHRAELRGLLLPDARLGLDEQVDPAAVFTRFGLPARAPAS